MELSELTKLELRPVETDFHGLKLVVNANAVTGRHFRDASAKIRAVEQAEKAAQKKQDKINAQIASLRDELLRLQEQMAATDDFNLKTDLQESVFAVQTRLRDLAPSTLEAFEGRGKETESICSLYAGLIKGTDDAPLLISWELTDQGEPVPCTEKELMKRHPDLLAELYHCCLQVSRPKEPEIRTMPPSRTISETSGGITPTPETPPGEDLPMLMN